MSTLDALNKRLSMWKREKALRGNSRFDVDSTIEEIEDEIKKILNLGIEISELAQLRAALAQAQAERDAATRRAEDAESALSRCRVQALEQAAQIVEGWAGSYPADMFPPDGNDRYSIAGTALRLALPMVAGAIRAALAGQEGGPR